MSSAVVVGPSMLQPMQNHVLMETQTAQLWCNVSGWPTPSVSWTKNGEVVMPSSRVSIDGHRLMITQATVMDSGIYQCWAENVAGHVVLTATVLVGMSQFF